MHFLFSLFFDISMLGRMSRVNKHWYKALKYNQAWTRYLKNKEQFYEEFSLKDLVKSMIINLKYSS